MKTKLLLFAVIISVVLSACKGDKGDLGPQGTQGTQGPTGPSGSVNVSTFTLNASSWTYQGLGSYYANFAPSEISQSIVDNGVVLAYASNGSGGWATLPVTYYYNSSISYTFSYVYALYSMAFYFQWSDQTPGTPAPRTFKVVVIPGSIARDNPFIDYDNYSEVRATFNLND